MSEDGNNKSTEAATPATGEQNPMAQPQPSKMPTTSLREGLTIDLKGGRKEND